MPDFLPRGLGLLDLLGLRDRIDNKRAFPPQSNEVTATPISR
jgi:hypothetical protein